MKKVFLQLFFIASCSSALADEYYPNNSVFPVLNTVSDSPEFTVCSIGTTYEHDGKRAYMSDIIQICKFGDMTKFDIKYSGSLTHFVSFTYVTYNKCKSEVEWNHGSVATQFAFHPGGIADVDYSDSESPLSIPMYAFTYNMSSNDFNLVDLRDMSVIATLYKGDLLKSVFLTVFAGADRNSQDIIVIAGKDTYKIYGTFVENGASGIREISPSDVEPSYFGINGQKYDKPKKGVNIVVNGQETKKVIGR